MGQWIFIPLVGALIGWTTNVLAIRLLFRPYKPWRIPLLGWKIQGVIPKRQGELAHKIGKVIEEELLSVEEILHRFNTPANQKLIIDAIVPAIYFRLMRTIPPFIPVALKEVLGRYIRDILEREAPAIFDHITDKIINILSQEISLATVVEEKINNYDMRQLERIILNVVSRELRHIELLGGVLGFLIGLVQVGSLLILEI